MRIALAALLLLAAGSAFEPANADPYRWCALYSGKLSGGSNCWFMTLEQCRASVSGIGGQCIQNPRNAYDDAPRRSKRS